MTKNTQSTPPVTAVAGPLIVSGSNPRYFTIASDDAALCSEDESDRDGTTERS